MSCRRKTKIFLTANDLLPVLPIELEGVDITGYTINLNIDPSDDRDPFARTAIHDFDNPGGTGTALAHFEWQIGDLLAGEHEAEIEIFDTSNKNETFQGLVLVIPDDITIP